MRVHLITLGLIFALCASARGQVYYAPFYESGYQCAPVYYSPVVTYSAPILTCPPEASISAPIVMCPQRVDVGTTYYASPTLSQRVETRGPDLSQRPPATSVVWLMNSSDHDLSDVWIEYTTDSNVNYKTQPFSIARGASKRITQLPERPRFTADRVKVSVHTSKGVLKGDTDGTMPRSQILYEICTENTLVGITVP